MMRNDVLLALISSLDEMMEHSPAGPQHHADIDAFLESGWMRDHIRGMAIRALDRIKGREHTMLTPDSDNPAMMFRDGERMFGDEGAGKRELFLRSGNARSSYHSVFEEPFVIVAIDDIVVEELIVEGLENGDFYYPHPGVSLRRGRSWRLSRGEAIVRADPEAFLNVQQDDSAKYLTYIRGERPASYRLVFDKQSLRLIATGGLDLVTAKALSYLEVLEAIGSPLLAEIAMEYTSHYSPVIRWRALSSLNKIRHPETETVLHQFCNDEVAFVARGAARILAEGKR